MTAPGDNALWFMYEPVLISKRTWDKLDDKQKAVLKAASAKAEAYFAAESKKPDDKMVEAFKKAGDEVVTPTTPSSTPGAPWRRRPPYKEFGEKVPGGKELIEKALSVK